MLGTKYVISALIVASGIAISIVRGQSETEPTIERIDAAFDRLISPEARAEKIVDGFQFLEGPVWVRNSGFLLFSELRDNAILKWTPDGNVSVFRKPVFAGTFPEGALMGPNGLTLDPLGRLITAEHGGRRITRAAISRDGKIATDQPVKVLADRYEGKRLNSPNDVVSRRNGDLYFTDPVGLFRSYPRNASDPPKPELDFGGLYRLTTTGKLELLARDIPFPNGLAFSPDDKRLYVSSSAPRKEWMVYDVNPDGGIQNGRVFLDVTNEPGQNVPDGMKIDQQGNLYASGPGGLWVISSDAKHLGTIRVPGGVSNCAFGETDGRTLFFTTSTSVYRLRLKIGGRAP